MTTGRVLLYLLITPASAVAMTFPSLDQESVDYLVRRQYPFEQSLVNCHATSMFAAGALSVLSAQTNEETYFSSGCFLKIEDPRPGDVGFWIDAQNAKIAYHSFVYVDENRIFEKANPGWTKNPFSLLNVSKAKIPKYYAQYVDHGAKLVWGRYAPSASCHLTQFQGWLDSNR